VLINKLFPEEKRDVYLKWILIGLLIRLSLMPFTLHGDLIGINWLARGLVYQGYLPQERMDYPPLVYFTAFFFQLLFKPAMPLFGQWWDATQPWFSGPHLFRYLFLLKSWYLIFDLGVAFLLLRLIVDNQKRLLAFKFWMINPVVILVCYAHGQYDIVPTFFVALSLYYVAVGKSGRSLFSLGIGAAFKHFSLLLLIPALILLGKSKIAKIKLMLYGVVPYVLLMYPYWRSPAFRDVATTAGGYDQRILNFYFDLGNFDKVYVFIIGYTIILAFTYFRHQIRDGKEAFKTLWRVELIVFLWLYTTILFHVHWFIWVTPLLILLCVEDRKVSTLYWLQIVCVFVYTFYWGRYLLDLFAPLDPFFFAHLKGPYEIINQYYSAPKFIRIFRSIFSGICLWMTYLILREFFSIKKRS